MDTSDQDSNFFHVGCISAFAALPPIVEGFIVVVVVFDFHLYLFIYHLFI